MNRDQIEGKAKEVKGAVKDAAGRVINDPKLQASGKADKVEGKVQGAYGKARDAAGDAVEKAGRKISGD